MRTLQFCMGWSFGLGFGLAVCDRWPSAAVMLGWGTLLAAVAYSCAVVSRRDGPMTDLPRDTHTDDLHRTTLAAFVAGLVFGFFLALALRG